MPSSKSNLIIIIIIRPIIRINLSQFRNSDPLVCSLDFFVTPLFVVSVPRFNCALRIKKCAPRISSGIYF